MTANPGQPEPAFDPAALSIRDMSRLISAAGGRPVTPEQVQADVDAGAPTAGRGADGQVRMNLVHYAAWLAREVQAR